MVFIQSDLIPPLEKEIDLLCANLPYIPTGRLPSLKVSKWEPQTALNGGRDGLDQVRRLLLSSRGRLSVDAAIMLEVDVSNAAAAAAFAHEVYPQAVIQLIQDLSGRDRLLSLQLQ